MPPRPPSTISRVPTPENHTPIRHIRVPDSIWTPATAIAAERGETVSDVVRRALTSYVKRNTRPGGPQT